MVSASLLRLLTWLSPAFPTGGFAYSAGMKAKEGTWTYDDLNLWLKKPAAFVPGTKMTFVGVPDIKDRADVIAYLRSLAADPVPLPAK